MKRRQFLNALGLAGLGSSLAPWEVARAVNRSGAAPHRLIVISHCHGWTYDTWKLRPDGLDNSSPWEVDLTTLKLSEFSPVLSPLYDHRNRIIPIDALSLATAELDADGNRHDKGFVHAWTGGWVDFSTAEARGRTASLDQLVARAVRRSDRLPSLELGVDDIREAGRPISYALNGARLPVETSAERVWQRLFGPSIAPNPLQSRQVAALDYAWEEMRALSPHISSPQRIRLETHYEHLRQLRARLDSMSQLECSAPDIPTENTSYDTRFDAMSDMIGAAFMCDLTRVVSLTLGELPTADIGWDGLTDDVHKGLAHEIYNSAEKHQAMSDYITHHSRQVARLIARLEQIPDSDGRSVMDNTLILWGSELADGWHGYQHYCPVIIGGGWHFNTGRYIYRPRTTPVEILQPVAMDGGGYSATSGLPHQHVLVSAAQAMGMDTNVIGIELTQGQRGDNLDCRGPLEGLV